MPWNCCIHVVCTATDLTTGSPQQATVVISSLMLSSPPCGLATLLKLASATILNAQLSSAQGAGTGLFEDIM